MPQGSSAVRPINGLYLFFTFMSTDTRRQTIPSICLCSHSLAIDRFPYPQMKTSLLFAFSASFTETHCVERTTSNCLKIFRSVNFSYSNYVFNISTKCVYTIKYTYYYQHSTASNQYTTKRT